MRQVKHIEPRFVFASECVEVCVCVCVCVCCVTFTTNLISTASYYGTYFNHVQHIWVYFVGHTPFMCHTYKYILCDIPHSREHIWIHFVGHTPFTCHTHKYFLWDIPHSCVTHINTYCGASFCAHVATIGRLLKIIGLFCRISSLLTGSFAKETYNFKEPKCVFLWPCCGIHEYTYACVYHTYKYILWDTPRSRVTHARIQQRQAHRTLIHVCTCMCECVCVRGCLCVCACVHVYVWMCVCAWVLVRMNEGPVCLTLLYSCMCDDAPRHTRFHNLGTCNMTCRHTRETSLFPVYTLHIYMYIYIYICIYIYVCIHVYIYTHFGDMPHTRETWLFPVYILHVFMYIYVHMYTYIYLHTIWEHAAYTWDWLFPVYILHMFMYIDIYICVYIYIYTQFGDMPHAHESSTNSCVEYMGRLINRRFAFIAKPRRLVWCVHSYVSSCLCVRICTSVCTYVYT